MPLLGGSNRYVLKEICTRDRDGIFEKSANFMLSCTIRKDHRWKGSGLYWWGHKSKGKPLMLGIPAFSGPSSSSVWGDVCRQHYLGINMAEDVHRCHFWISTSFVQMARGDWLVNLRIWSQIRSHKREPGLLGLGKFLPVTQYLRANWRVR